VALISPEKTARLSMNKLECANYKKNKQTGQKVHDLQPPLKKEKIDKVPHRNFDVHIQTSSC
jgi:hypothetical protein